MKQICLVKLSCPPLRIILTFLLTLSSLSVLRICLVWFLNFHQGLRLIVKTSRIVSLFNLEFLKFEFK